MLKKYAVDFHCTNTAGNWANPDVPFTVLIMAPDAKTARLWAGGFVSGMYTVPKEITGCIELSIDLPKPGFFTPPSPGEYLNIKPNDDGKIS